jgi:hypothetical protein
MSARRVATVLGLLALALPALGAAQGLGDVAAREKAKRAQQAKAEAKVFTNEDLDAGRPPSTTGSGEPAGVPESGSAPAEPSGEDRAQGERPLLDAVTAAQASVASSEARVKELGDKLNPMSGSFIYGATGSNDANEELRVRAEMQEAEARLLEARQALAAANQSLQDFRQGRAPSPSGSSPF